jgi:hypothetical protein
MVAGFMASLKVAVTMLFEHAPMALFGGATEVTVGGVNPGIVRRSESLQPAPSISNKNVMTQAFWLLDLDITVILYPLASTNKVASQLTQPTQSYTDVVAAAATA